KLQPYCPLVWTNRAYQCPGYKGVVAPLGFSYFSSYAYNAGGADVGDSAGSQPIRSISARSPSLGLSGGQDGYGLQRPVGEQQVIAPSQMFAISDSRTMDVIHTPTFPRTFADSGVDWAAPTIL